VGVCIAIRASLDDEATSELGRSMSQRTGGHLAAHDASSVLSTDAVRSNN
jgi:hypothetical protein